MVVKELRVQHIRGVRRIHIHATDVNELVGKGGAGKSTLMDAIRFAFGGPKAVDRKMLRNGESEGEIILTTDDGWEITRKVREGKGPTVKITHNGAKRLQGDLDKLFTDFAFDPLAFSGMKVSEQFKTYQSLAGPEVVKQLADMDKAIKDAEAERTLTGREIKRFGEVVVPAEPDESGRIDTAAVTVELRKVEAFNQEQDDIAANLERKADEVYNSTDHLKTMEGEVHRAKAELEAAEAELAASVKRHEALEKVVADLPRPQDRKPADDLYAKLAEAGDVNGAIDHLVSERKAALAAQEELEAMKQKRSEQDDEVEYLRGQRQDVAKSIKLPVEGMVFTDDGIRVDGKAFNDLSKSERIRASAKIGMALNSELNVMLVEDGALLGEEGFAELKAVAAEHKVQLWVETIGKEGYSGEAIHIEAGELKK
jgi:DNA repair exonuclease SbcCD ATPase subunit